MENAKKRNDSWTENSEGPAEIIDIDGSASKSGRLWPSMNRRKE